MDTKQKVKESSDEKNNNATAFKDDSKKLELDCEEQIAENEKLIGEIEELKKTVDEYHSKYMRALADYQNLEKRSIEERTEWIKGAGKNILLHILPVLDTLMLASRHTTDDNLLVSIAQFLDALKAEGVTRIEAVGKKFDPVTMEAIQVIDGEDGKVMEEVRAGFMLHGKLLRPVEVIVGRK